LPFGKKSISFVLHSNVVVQLIAPRVHIAPIDQAGIIKTALNDPINSTSLKELTKNVKKILIITNDNTRPMPSKFTIPAIINAFFYPQTYYDITILIANGLHRKMTQEEMIEQFGKDTYEKYKIVNHVATDESQLAFLGKMSTGNELWLNRLVVENELVISEGFIEAHFFVGFSGGRKSILPGVAGAKTIIQNHRPENIANKNSNGSNLNGNPIHMECVEAALMAKLGFILNVALNEEKKIIGAFAGHPIDAHLKGCEFVKEAMSIKVHSTDIVITSNNGYPLDRNLYQVVKGIDIASRVVAKDGVIIMAAQCIDGVGHKQFKEMILSCSSIEELNEKMSVSPSEIDKWQVQILARAMARSKIILVSENLEKEEVEDMFFLYAGSLEEALDIALQIKGKDASISIMPEGPVVIPVIDQFSWN
jgi:Uncharacterized conserved protein